MADSKPRRGSFVGVGSLVFAGTLIWSIGGFAYSALAGRFLSVGDYGTLYAMISLYAVAIIPAGIFSPVVSRYAAEFEALEDRAHARELFVVVVRGFAILGAVYIAIPLIFPHLLGGLLHIRPWESVLVALMAAVSMIALGLRAISQGIHAYGLYSASVIVEGFGRVGGLVAFLLVGLTVANAAAGFLAGLFLGGAIVAVALAARYAKFPKQRLRLDWRRMAHSTFASSALALAMGLMGYLDVVLVKHYFDPLDAGLYASASLVAKILLYVVSFVPAVLIPQATDRHTRGERTRYVLWAAFGFVALVVVVGLIAYAFEGRSLLHAFVGQKYDAADGILAVYAVAMAALALTNTFASYALATHRLAFVWPLFATTIATIAAIVVVHPSLYAVALDMAVGNFAMLLAAAVPLAVQSRVRSPSSRTS